MVIKAMITGLLGLFILVGCSNASFQGGSDGSPVAEGGEQPPPAETPAPPECEIDGDQVKINSHAATIIECIEKGMIYHFGWGKCTDVPAATTFECSFAGVKGAVESLNMNTESIDKAITEDSKLIGCGEKNEGNTIVVQWWKNVGDECNFDSSSTMTVCFKHYGTGERPPAPTTPEETAERVRQCIEE